MFFCTEKTPGDGFEPPLKEPESFVLPLDDPGKFYSIFYQLSQKCFFLVLSALLSLAFG